MTIRAILFDLDGTLRFSRPSGLEAFVQFSAELGLTLCVEAQRKVERWTHAYWAGKHSGYAKAMPDLEAFWLDYTRGMLTAAGVEDAALVYTPAIVHAFNERYHSEPYIPAQVHTVLRALRENRYTLGLVSNREGDLTPLAAELGLGDYFHFTLSGGQANSWKPDARIFVLACEMAQATPNECLYVGDNFYADTLGAQAAGLIPVLLDPRRVFLEAECARIASLTEMLSVVAGVGNETQSLRDTWNRS
jgi:HAD superfamily hydrolase (TIGR01549 family)